MTSEMLPEPPPTNPPPISLSAELERALFKRFWAWLAIVGSVVIVVVSGLSVIASQAVNTLVSEKIDLALKRIVDVENRALDAAFKTSTAQGASAGAASAAAKKAEEAEKAVLALNNRIKEFPDVGTLVKNLQTAADSLATNPAFAKGITDGLAGSIFGHLQIRLRKGSTTNNSDFYADCQTDEIIVGGSCIITSGGGTLQNQGTVGDKRYACTYVRPAVTAEVFAACLGLK